MIKQLIKRIIFGYKASGRTYVTYLKKKGIKVGEHIEISFPHDTFIDTLNPHLLTIGSNVSMTGPVSILTHDYSVCVLKKKYNGEILGKQRSTSIGNNVFLGWGCTVLPGAVIEDNVIVGANAVVTGTLEHDSIYAGNPARRICSLEDYYKRRKNVQVKEAKIIYDSYKERFNKIPPKEIFHEYFMLFSKGDVDTLIPEFKTKLRDHGNENESVRFLQNNTPVFENYEKFLQAMENYNVD